MVTTLATDMSMLNQQKTVFLDMFGSYPYLKVLDFLIRNEEFDYSMTQIASLKVSQEREIEV